jgi:S-formylglutathione hydrolase FrmB
MLIICSKYLQRVCREAQAEAGRSILGEGVVPGFIPTKGWFMRRVVAALLLLTSTAAPVRGQVFDWVNLDRVNSKLGGRVIDFTQNHGADRRICSPILGRPRDLYVYLPPGYDPSVAYPLVIFLHGAHIDEHAFLDPGVLKKLDRMISQGEVPAAIIAAPDGTYEGKNRITSTHSLWVNGLGGRFEDHVVDEILPLLMRTYSIRPEREAHALLGISAGGFGATTIAMKHRDVFGAVATVGGPLNVRYDNRQGRYSDDFDPATYRARTEYDPDMIIARYYFGLVRRRAKTFFERVYGTGQEVSAKVVRDNPADVLASTDLRPGELAMYINHPDRDNYNFDAQDQSFAWLAAQRGLAVDLTETPGAEHNLSYIQRAEPPACFWLGQHILPPARRLILAEMAARREPDARRTRLAVSTPSLPMRD